MAELPTSSPLRRHFGDRDVIDLWTWHDAKFNLVLDEYDPREGRYWKNQDRDSLPNLRAAYKCLRDRIGFYPVHCYWKESVDHKELIGRPRKHWKLQVPREAIKYCLRIDEWDQLLHSDAGCSSSDLEGILVDDIGDQEATTPLLQPPVSADWVVDEGPTYELNRHQSMFNRINRRCGADSVTDEQESGVFRCSDPLTVDGNRFWIEAINGREIVLRPDVDGCSDEPEAVRSRFRRKDTVLVYGVRFEVASVIEKLRLVLASASQLRSPSRKP